MPKVNIKRDFNVQNLIKYQPPNNSDTDLKIAMENFIGNIKYERPKETFIDI